MGYGRRYFGDGVFEVKEQLVEVQRVVVAEVLLLEIFDIVEDFAQEPEVILGL